MEKPLLSGNNRTSITKYTRKAGTTKIDFSNMTLDKLIRKGGYECECGRHHGAGLKYLKIGRDATQHTVEAMQAIQIFDRLRSMKPDRVTAEKALAQFDPAACKERVRRIFGRAAQTLIDKEKNVWHKNDPQKRGSG